ncbi:MAG: hypothetical protein ACI4GA_00820 [Acutalibacteraceae bacterium]|nr:hypothetical protein [Oscillospiraceae bacterium]
MTYSEWYRKYVDNSGNSDKIDLESEKMSISSIEKPIEFPIEQRNTGKGNPNAILTFDVELNNRQKMFLESLPDKADYTG